MGHTLRALGLLLFVLSACVARAQTFSLRGKVIDPEDNGPIIGGSVVLLGTAHATGTNNDGRYLLTGIAAGTYTVRTTFIGHGVQDSTLTITGDATLDIAMPRRPIDLREVNISPRSDITTATTISGLDRSTRPVNSSQDLLQLVPGLFIAQHAGGGKAEQIFFRGFDIDHGTDLQVSVDGMPVNMVSHAHGQGYADLHFTIPETMDKLLVHKGPYNARFGDFATSGTVEFRTKDHIDHSEVKLEYGMFNTARVVGLFDLLGDKHLLAERNENAYIAAEYAFTDAYFNSKQDFGRLNLFGKYTGQLGESTHLTFSGSTFSAAWNASGQVPERAVDSGLIDRFGAIDDDEGGNTSRTNLYATLVSGARNGGVLKNQVYFVKYDFNLYSNFTFFSVDSVRGDMIAQTDDRTITGYSGSYSQDVRLGDRTLHLNAGVGARYDRADIALKNALERVVYDTIVAGNVDQLNANTYLDGTLALTDRFSINAAARLDVFMFDYTDARGVDSTSGKATQQRVSPKLNLTYTAPIPRTIGCSSTCAPVWVSTVTTHVPWW
jgi:hypothetical protein